MKFDGPKYSFRKPDPYWRGARIIARLIEKTQAGIPLSSRDRRVGHELIQAPGITNRLIDQALACRQE